AADVLDDPDVACRVVLDAFVTAASEGPGDVSDGRGGARSGRVGGSVLVLGGEQQPPGPRVPGRAIDGRDRVTAVVLRREQRDPVRGIRVEVDPGDVGRTARAELVALEQEVRAVVVVRVGAGQAVLEDKVGVLVGLCLFGLSGRCG